MQIQRVQTLWLLLAIVCMVLFILHSFGAIIISETDIVEVCPVDYPVIAVPAVLSAVLQLIAVFSYKNLSLQRRIIVLSMIMTIVAAGIMVYIVTTGTMAEVMCVWPVTFIVANLLACVLAISGINRDMRLLRSYDRLR